VKNRIPKNKTVVAVYVPVAKLMLEATVEFQMWLMFSAWRFFSSSTFIQNPIRVFQSSGNPYLNLHNTKHHFGVQYILENIPNPGRGGGIKHIGRCHLGEGRNMKRGKSKKEENMKVEGEKTKNDNRHLRDKIRRKDQKL
jgi:hypothetical protein